MVLGWKLFLLRMSQIWACVSFKALKSDQNFFVSSLFQNLKFYPSGLVKRKRTATEPHYTQLITVRVLVITQDVNIYRSVCICDLRPSVS